MPGTPYAMKFGAGTTAVVNVPAATSINDLPTFSMLSWCYPTSAASARNMEKGASNRYLSLYNSATRATIQCGRVTAACRALADLTAFAAYGLNKWICLAGVIVTGGVNADQLLLMGDLTTPLSQPSAYVQQQVGSGTVNTDNATVLKLGNSSNGGLNNLPFPGLIATAVLIPFALSIGDLCRIQFGGIDRRAVGRWTLGKNGTGPVIDESGNGNHGTISGAVPTSDYLPHVSARRVVQ